jgi:hypothetical protein
MKFTSTLAVSVLATEAFGLHAGHRHHHKRDVEVVEVVETDTIDETVYADSDGNVYSSSIAGTSVVDVTPTSSAPVVQETSVAAATSSVVAEQQAATSASEQIIVATYNGEVFSWTTTYGAAAAATPAAAVAVSVAVDVSTSATEASTTAAASSTYVAPTTSETPSSTYVATTFATSAASSSVASVASSSTSSAVTSASTSTGRRGLSYNDASLTEAFSGSSEVGWAYNWGATSDDLTGDFEYIPMLWGLTDSLTSAWADAVSTAVAAGSSHLLAFNEPDLQSDISSADAATGYKTYMNPYTSQAKLGAPAVTNGGSPMGLTWLEAFIADCNDECIIDFVPIHWYDTATNYVYFKEYIQEAYVAGGNRTLWITEFGATGTADEQNTFLEVVLPWLDSLDYVERYAYFMCADDSLISGTSLSTLGSTYSSYTSTTISASIADV